MPRRNNRIEFDTSLSSDLIVKPRSCPSGKFIYLTEDSAWDYVNNLWKTPLETTDDLPDYADFCNECGFYHVYCSDPEDWYND